MFTVFIEGLDIYAYHGVPVAERAVGHRYRVDIRLLVSGNADVTDELFDTVDYGLVGTMAEETVRNTQFQTVERLAAVIGDLMLQEFPLVQEATVTVRKPLPPAPIIAESAGATVIRARDRSS